MTVCGFYMPPGMAVRERGLAAEMVNSEPEKILLKTDVHSDTVRDVETGSPVSDWIRHP